MNRWVLWAATARGSNRFGMPINGRQFYDVHVEADEVHQYLAVNELVGGLLESEPEQATAVMFGARAVSLDRKCFRRAMSSSAWKSGLELIVAVVSEGHDPRLTASSSPTTMTQSMEAPLILKAPSIGSLIWPQAAGYLEFGVGTGRIAIPLAEQGLDVWGVDGSPDMLKRLR